jgi:hypothetical protein
MIAANGTAEEIVPQSEIVPQTVQFAALRVNTQ